MRVYKAVRLAPGQLCFSILFASSLPEALYLYIFYETPERDNT